MRTMRTPDGWEVAQVRLAVRGRTAIRLEVRSPAGTRIGSFTTPEAALAALRSHGVDPADLIDAVGGRRSDSA